MVSCCLQQHNQSHRGARLLLLERAGPLERIRWRSVWRYDLILIWRCLCYSEDDFTAYSIGVVPLQNGTQVVYSKYAGTEVEFNGTSHLILKEDDIVGILETDDIKDLKPLNDRVLIKVALALVILFLPSVWDIELQPS